MVKRLLYLILPLITLILELLPFGAVCVFAAGPDQVYLQTFSYFDLLPFGYANFGPLITAVLSCLVLLLLVIFCITGRYGFSKAAKYLLCVCTAFSLGPLFFGIRYFSVVGALISASLLAGLLVLHVTLRPSGSGK